MKGEEFNLFRHLHLTEEGHTSLLKKLLHKGGMHSMNDLFIKSFVEKVLKENYVDDMEVETGSPAGKKGRMDLFIGTPDKRFIYIIENKVKGAKDRQSQLYRYWRNHIKSAEESENLYHSGIYYLTYKGGKPSPKSLCKPEVNESKTTKYIGLPQELPMVVHEISYKKNIVDWLENCLTQIPKTEKNNRLICTIEQYVEWIKYI